MEERGISGSKVKMESKGISSSREKAVVVACDMVTAYGRGLDRCWQGLLAGKTAIGRLERFPTKSFQTDQAAVINGLEAKSEESLVIQMLIPLFTESSHLIPEEAFLILATTSGEIDFLEKYVLNDSVEAEKSCLNYLLEKVLRLSKVHNSGIIISAACASSSAAIAEAAAMIRDGEHDCVLVVACDCVSEFIMAGFSSLMALDKDIARPFDQKRNGLILGEAAGLALLMSEKRAIQEGRTVIGEVIGWGLTNDANHMTGPSRDGYGLALAIHKALHSADILKSAIGCISAHGTGTVYNDAMEMKAFKRVFGDQGIPTYSIKGGTGHTMATAGLIEMMIAFQSMRDKIVPPTVNTCEIDEEAKGWVSPNPCPFNGEVTLSTNSGFGGINVALVLRKASQLGAKD